MADPYREWASSADDDQVIDLLVTAGFTEVTIRRLRVRDGILFAIRTCAPPDKLWHLQITHQPKRQRREPRIPTWDEVIDARRELLPPNAHMIASVPYDGFDAMFCLDELREPER